MLNAKVTYTNGLQFVGEASSGHAIVMDGDTGVGGHNTGLRPMELLLVSLGGCTGMDVISIMKKKQQDVTGFEININGQKAESYPKKFTDITIEYIVRGRGISEEALKKSIDLSMNKYCSIKASLEATAKISFSYRIIQEQG
jgi:putative redox protein